ncbi:hypothetical protein CRE_00526 [Caenorhabditis remanei]|uniref:Uncharacterized protein n=1 Tax=Caenorhabditis remanei TaxID=31234 RepID=E3LCU6_CAERE|nr:hypothetical protein CRE_00526 [Caenorhabditis remanei]
MVKTKKTKDKGNEIGKIPVSALPMPKRSSPRNAKAQGAPSFQAGQSGKPATKRQVVNAADVTNSNVVEVQAQQEVRRSARLNLLGTPPFESTPVANVTQKVLAVLANVERPVALDVGVQAEQGELVMEQREAPVTVDVAVQTDQEEPVIDQGEGPVAPEQGDPVIEQQEGPVAADDAAEEDLVVVNEQLTHKAYIRRLKAQGKTFSRYL